MSDNNIHRVALFGAGRIGNVHSVNIHAHQETEIAYVIDPYEEGAKKLAASVGAKVGTTRQAMEDTSVDGIVICSATNTHADLIEQGIAAGKAVFCEKPVDLSLKRVDALLAKIAGKSDKLFVAFNRRFDPGIVAMHKRITGGAIGDPELITVISKDPGAPPADYIKVSGGLFRDMTIHDLDMARFLLGDEPVSVHATASTLTDPVIKTLDDFDTAIVTLQTASGRMATITNSRRASFGYDQRVEVHGSKGMLSTINMPETTLVQSDGTGVTHEKPMHFFLERYAQSYKNEWEHFVNVMNGEKKVLCSVEDGRKALALAEAAYESVKTGRVVSISPHTKGTAALG
mgnify:CR=1 FL=1